MRLEYTITKGSLYVEGKNCEIPFALVFQENGVFFVETFLQEGFFDREDFFKEFSLFGVTEQGFDIAVSGLNFKKYKSNNCKARFICRNFVKLIDQRRKSSQILNINKDDEILFLEIEGLKIEFADRTDIRQYRGYGQTDDLNVNFDHTSCRMYIQVEGFEENYFHLVFSEAKEKGVIQINFTKTRGYSHLTFEHYQTFKKEFIAFLSFLNGGQVLVRRELVGGFYKNDGSDSQIVYNYSFNKISTNDVSDYVPINKHHSFSSRIFSHVFIDCFNNFYHQNKTLDLISIVDYINTSFSTSGVRQAYSVLINALEKICSDYVKSNNHFDEFMMDNEIWEESIRIELYKVLDVNRRLINSVNKNTYNSFKSKVGGMNRRNNSTVQKMFDLLQYGNIPINNNVQNLVNKERHTAVHKAEFGETKRERLINYYKLDHVLRDLILNIIDYRQDRQVVWEYATREEKDEVYPKRGKFPVLFISS